MLLFLEKEVLLKNNNSEFEFTSNKLKSKLLNYR